MRPAARAVASAEGENSTNRAEIQLTHCEHALLCGAGFHYSRGSYLFSLFRPQIVKGRAVKSPARRSVILQRSRSDAHDCFCYALFA